MSELQPNQTNLKVAVLPLCGDCQSIVFLISQLAHIIYMTLKHFLHWIQCHKPFVISSRDEWDIVNLTLPFCQIMVLFYFRDTRHIIHHSKVPFTPNWMPQIACDFIKKWVSYGQNKKFDLKVAVLHFAVTANPWYLLCHD